jgi:hypothetical protein
MEPSADPVTGTTHGRRWPVGSPNGPGVGAPPLLPGLSCMVTTPAVTLSPALVCRGVSRGVYRTMICANQRRCDICDELIPRGTLYRVGRISTDELESWREDNPEFMPAFTEEDGDVVRFDVCTTCAIVGTDIAAITEPTVDGLE